MGLCEDLVQFLAAEVDLPTAPVAWQLLRTSISASLVYDQQLCDPSVLRPAVARLDAAVDRVLCALLQVESLEPSVRAQIARGDRCGGFGLPTAAGRGDFLFLSTCFRIVPAVLNGCDSGLAEEVIARREPAVCRIVERFADEGIFVNARLDIVTDRGLSAAQLLGHLRESPAVGIAKLYAKWCGQVDRIRADRAFELLRGDELRALHLACQNEVGGKWLVDPRAPLRDMHNERWTVAARLRLGLHVLRASELDDALCQAAYTDTAKGKCRARLDAHGVHATSCAVGAQRIQRHMALSMHLYRFSRGWFRGSPRGECASLEGLERQ